MAEYEITGTKQITELPEATSYTDGMYYAVASASGGTQKIDANVPTPTEQIIINTSFDKGSTDSIEDDTSFLSKTVKRIISFLPSQCVVTKCQQVVVANSNQYVKLEIWEENDGIYTLSRTITGTIIGESANEHYILDFGSFSVSKKSFLTFDDTSSGGWLWGKVIEGSTNYTFSLSATSVTLEQMTTTTQKPACKVEYFAFPLNEEVKNVEKNITALNESVEPVQNVVMHTAQESGYVLELNNSYVWMFQRSFPQNSIPKIVVHTPNSSSAGTVMFYFFNKNANDTYSLIGSYEMTTSTGDHAVVFPDGITAEKDLYVGIYSNTSGITYKNGNLLPTSRCDVSALSSEEITIDGTFDIEFNIDVSYTIVNKLNDRVTALEGGINTYTIVDASGHGKYTSLLDAMTNEPEGTVIFVMKGIYEQDMSACLAKRVIVIGADRNQCIIRDTDGRYGHHPLYVSCGFFENLTIEAPYVQGISNEIDGTTAGAYAVHIDTDGDYAVGKQLEFHHCTIRSDFFPAIGCGMRKDMTLIIDDCILENRQVAGRGNYSNDGSLGALYFHDSNGVQGNQYVILKDSVLKSKLKYAMCPYQVSRDTQNNKVYCDFINNVLYSDVGKYTDTIWFRGDPFNADTGIFEIGIGFGNSIDSINND